jgi:ATP-dependent RNA helicase DDX19/DBP5
VPIGIEHFFAVVEKPAEAAPEIMRRYYCARVDSGQAIVFFAQKSLVGGFAAAMKQTAYTCRATHGDIDVAERRRTIADFADGKFKLLATTDLLARGLDVPQVSLVVQVGIICESPKDRRLTTGSGTRYQHRAGRAGRYGRNGICLSIIRRSDIKLLHTIEADLGIVIRQLRLDHDLPGEIEVR